MPVPRIFFCRTNDTKLKRYGKEQIPLKKNYFPHHINDHCFTAGSAHPECAELIDNLNHTKSELDTLSHNLNFVTDPILLNQMIFQLKAVEVRYQYWFCKARNMGLDFSE